MDGQKSKQRQEKNGTEKRHAFLPDFRYLIQRIGHNKQRDVFAAGAGKLMFGLGIPSANQINKPLRWLFSCLCFKIFMNKIDYLPGRPFKLNAQVPGFLE